MILACPECGTAFHIELLAINKGRKVKCGVCSNIWFASPNNLRDEPKKVEKNIQPIQNKPKIESSIPPEKIELKNNLIQKPIVSKEIDRSIEFEKKKNIKKVNFIYTNILNWLAFWLVLSILILGGIGYWGKNIVVAYLPETLKIYNILNMKILPRISKLEVLDLKAENEGDLIIIRGKIFNKSFLPTFSPVISVITINKEGNIIENFDIKAEKNVINAQQDNFFKAEIYLPEGKENEITDIRAILINEIPN